MGLMIDQRSIHVVAQSSILNRSLILQLCKYPIKYSHDHICSTITSWYLYGKEKCSYDEVRELDNTTTCRHGDLV